MMSKWEWIEKACETQGYIESAKVARQIEDVLYRLYGTTITKAWRNLEKKEVEGAFKNEPFDIISNVDYCCACEESKKFCDECIFGMEVGTCNRKDSLYVKFCDIFGEEQSKK